MKKIFTMLLVAGLGWYTVEHTRFGEKIKAKLGSIADGSHTSKKTAPSRERIKLARAEIAKMDAEIDRMVRPLAEYTASVNKLKKDITTTESNLAEQKEILQILARDLETKATTVSYGGKTFSAEKIEAKLQKDFKSYQRLESQLTSQKAMLEAKQTSLRGVQEQMAKAMVKKQEFEVRLAQLEADEEILQIAKMGTKLQIDQTLTTKIEAALGDIAHQHGVDRAELELRTGKVVEDDIAVVTRPEPKVDASSILRYLENPVAASNK